MVISQQRSHSSLSTLLTSSILAFLDIFERSYHVLTMAPSLNFLDFPKEIRLSVYAVLKDFATEHREATEAGTLHDSHLSHGLRSGKSYDFRRITRTRKNLRLTCKQINEEWSPLFWKSTTICIDRSRSPKQFSETVVSSGTDTIVANMRHVELHTQVPKLSFYRLRRRRGSISICALCALCILCTHSANHLIDLFTLLCHHEVISTPKQVTIFLESGCCSIPGSRCPSSALSRNEHGVEKVFSLNKFIHRLLAKPLAGASFERTRIRKRKVLILTFKRSIMTPSPPKEIDAGTPDGNLNESGDTANIEEKNGTETTSSVHANGQKRTSFPDADPNTSEAGPKRLKLE